MMVAVLSFRREYGNGQFPRDRDFAALPEFQAIIDVPDEVQVTPGSFAHLRPLVPGFVINWHQQRLRRLEESLREHMDIPHGTPLIGLAVNQYHRCSFCDLLLDIPSMFVHNCRRFFYWEDSSAYNEAADKVTRSWLEVPYEQESEMLKGILAACGQDYLSCTVEDMDNLDVRLTCRTCRDNTSMGEAAPWSIMNWRSAVRTK